MVQKRIPKQHLLNSPCFLFFNFVSTFHINYFVVHRILIIKLEKKMLPHFQSSYKYFNIKFWFWLFGLLTFFWNCSESFLSPNLFFKLNLIIFWYVCVIKFQAVKFIAHLNSKFKPNLFLPHHHLQFSHRFYSINSKINTLISFSKCFIASSYVHKFIFVYAYRFFLDNIFITTIWNHPSKLSFHLQQGLFSHHLHYLILSCRLIASHTDLSNHH